MLWPFVLLALLGSIAGNACGSKEPFREAEGKIAFAAKVDGAWRLLIVNADGSGKAAVAPEPKDWPIDDAVWSPDGSAIAFNDFDYLTAVKADGSAYVRLYYDANSYTPFEWSGNGDQVAFVSADPRREFFTPAIFVVRADGGARHMVVDGDFPSWSPDGRTIAFLRGRFIRVINSDGTGEHKLARFDGSVEEGGLQILWSRDGQKIAYTTFIWKNPKRECESSGSCNYIDPDTNTELCRLQIVRADGRSRVQLTGGGLLGKFFEQCDISWSPDGRQVAFTRNGFLYSTTADGRRERRLARGLKPSWSPDGSRIALLRAGWIYVVDLQHDGQYRLGRGDELSWSPDGTSLVISRAINGRHVIQTMHWDGSHEQTIWPRTGRTCECDDPAWQPR